MHITKIITTLVCVTFIQACVAQVGSNSSVVNPNLAKKDELTALPGVTPAIGDALSDSDKATLRAKLFLPINLNTVSDAELSLVPGINRKMKHEFEEYRPYTFITQFQREIGKYVDDKEVARFEQYVFVPMDLNSASSEAFGSIPGMSRRMVREFNEYRPYTSMDQFRREIGKYVDDNEVARLERYVFIK